MNFPDDTQRLLVIGRTGTGKSVAGTYHLALRNYDEMPYLVINVKEDALLNSIGDEFGKHIQYSASLPKKPGLYIVHGHPDDIDGLRDLLTRIWERENIGVFFDEMLPIGKEARLLLTQGRAKHIPLIMCTQKPAWIDTYCFSESEFFQVFNLNTRDDKERITKFIPILRYHPKYLQPEESLPKFHSYYYDIAENDLRVLGPVPPPDQIIEIIRRKMPKRKWF